MNQFSKVELRDLIIAFVVLSFCFAISNVGLDVNGILSILPIVMFGVGIGFIFHELGHKYVAMKNGCRAEFKVWPIGLLIGFVSAFFGVVFAFPGEVKTYAENLTEELEGKITVAGPAANILLAFIFIVVAAFIYPLKFSSDFFNLIFLICTVGFSVNGFLATFNMLPVWSLDGIKVLKWNWKVWIVTFAVAALMMLSSISIGAEDMVKLIMIM